MTPSPPPSTSQTTTAKDTHDECVLCCYPLPLNPDESQYQSCCRQLICGGCIMAQKRTLIIGTNVKKPIAGSKLEELEFIRILTSKQIMVCPFCRTKDPTNDKELLKRLWKQIDDYKDPKAMQLLGGFYMEGEHGLSKNLKRAKELCQLAYALGDPTAAYDLADLYTNYIPDQARMMMYLEEGVKRGHTPCMNILAIFAAQSGNHEEAKRQFMTAACSGDNQAMQNLMIHYQIPDSVVSKDDLATTLRAHKDVNDKRKSEPRAYAIRHKAFDNGLREKKRIDDDYTILQYFNSRRHPSQNMNATDFYAYLKKK